MIARRLVLWLALAAALLSSPIYARAQSFVSVTPVGSPVWQPVDFHLFSAPIGTPATDFAEFFQTLDQLLPPPEHIRRPGIGIGPGAAHAGPYDRELAEGVARLGFAEKTVFDVSEFSAPSGVFLIWMNIPGPNAPTGSSPDFASGPIIPNSIFPVRIAGDVYRNGAIFEQNAFGYNVPSLNALNPPLNVDGHSHFPFFGAEADVFGPAGLTDFTGAYEYRMTMRDVNGNGYNISARFQVTAIPEPGTMALLGTGGLTLLGFARRGRRRIPA